MPPLTIKEAQKIYQEEKQKEKKLYRRGMNVNRLFTEHGLELLRQLYDLSMGPDFDLEDFDAFDPVKMFQYRSRNSDIIDVIQDIEDLGKAQMTPEAKRVFDLIYRLSVPTLVRTCNVIQWNWDNRVKELEDTSKDTDSFGRPEFYLHNRYERELVRELRHAHDNFIDKANSESKAYMNFVRELKELDARKFASEGGLSQTVSKPGWINGEARLKSYYIRVFASALQKTNPELLQKISGASLEQIENYASRNNLTREKVIARCEYEDLTRYYRKFFASRHSRQTEIIANMPLSQLEEKAKSEYGVDRNRVYALGCYDDLARYYKRFIGAGCVSKGWSRPQILDETGVNAESFKKLQDIAQQYFGADAGKVYSWAVIDSINAKTVDWEIPVHKLTVYAWNAIKTGVDESERERHNLYHDSSLSKMLEFAKDELGLDGNEIEARGRNYDLSRYYHDYLLALKKARPDSIDLPENYEQLNLNQLRELSGKCRSFYIKEEDVAYWGAQEDLKKSYLRFIEAASENNSIPLPPGYENATLDQLESFTEKAYNMGRRTISEWGFLREFNSGAANEMLPLIPLRLREDLPLSYFVEANAKERPAEAAEKEKDSKQTDAPAEQPAEVSESAEQPEKVSESAEQPEEAAAAEPQNEGEIEYEDEENLGTFIYYDEDKYFHGKVTEASTIIRPYPSSMEEAFKEEPQPAEEPVPAEVEKPAEEVNPIAETQQEDANVEGKVPAGETWIEVETPSGEEEPEDAVKEEMQPADEIPPMQESPSESENKPVEEPEAIEEEIQSEKIEEKPDYKLETIEPRKRSNSIGGFAPKINFEKESQAEEFKAAEEDEPEKADAIKEPEESIYELGKTLMQEYEQVDKPAPEAPQVEQENVKPINVRSYITEIKALRNDLKSTLSFFSSDSDAFKNTLKYLDGLKDIDTYDQSLVGRALEKLSDKAAAYKQHAIDDPRPGNVRRDTRLAIMGKISKLAEDFKKGVPDPRKELINSATDNMVTAAFNHRKADEHHSEAEIRDQLVELEAYKIVMPSLSTYQLEKISQSEELAHKAIMSIHDKQKTLKNPSKEAVKNNDGPILH